MGSNGRPPLALCAWVDNEFGQVRLKARVMIEQPDGGLCDGVQWRYGGWDPGAEYDGLEVAAYVGESPSLAGEHPWRGVWGSSVYYVPPRIESARHARAIASVFARLQRGLDRLTRDDGHLAHGDFTTLLLRVARVLRIGSLYVRTSRKERDMSGQVHRRVSGADLQLWVTSVAADVDAGKVADHAR